jgi:hypothetical protein
LDLEGCTGFSCTGFCVSFSGDWAFSSRRWQKVSSAEIFIQERFADEDFFCDECGCRVFSDSAEVVEIDPVIKISGFDYPHRFLVCKDCADEFDEEVCF